MQVRIWLMGVAACAILGMAACSGGAPQDTQGQLTAAQAEIAQLRMQLQQAQASAATQGGAAATENVVYGFGPGRITIIEPQSARVVKEITSGLERTDFADPIVTPDNRWLLVNDQANAQVIVVDTAKQEIAKRIDVGPRPVHIFNPLKSNEIWTHSDEEGAFYVINTNTMEVTARVVAARDNTGHGKLIDHPTLGSKAYATNVTSPDVWIVDDRTRLDEHLGDVTDVIDAELGKRPVYLVRLTGDDLATMFRNYNVQPIDMPTEQVVYRVLGKRPI